MHIPHNISDLDKLVVIEKPHDASSQPWHHFSHVASALARSGVPQRAPSPTFRFIADIHLRPMLPVSYVRSAAAWGVLHLCMCLCMLPLPTHPIFWEVIIMAPLRLWGLSFTWYSCQEEQGMFSFLRVHSLTLTFDDSDLGLDRICERAIWVKLREGYSLLVIVFFFLSLWGSHWELHAPINCLASHTLKMSTIGVPWQLMAVLFGFLV